MATSKNTKKTTIYIPFDENNPTFKYVPFQQDGVEYYVERGMAQEVPLWVAECARQAGYIR